jgi:hypothetical protein
LPALLRNSSGNFATLAAVLETVAEEEMPAVQETIERVRHIDVDQYKYGFVTDIESDKAPKGLSEDTVRFISAKKKTREPFTYKDPCVELNPHVGYDAAATEAAKTSVKEFLRTVFKL